MRRDRNSHRVSVVFFDGLCRTVLRCDGGGRVRWAYRSDGMDVAHLKATLRAKAVGLTNLNAQRAPAKVPARATVHAIEIARATYPAS